MSYINQYIMKEYLHFFKQGCHNLKMFKKSPKLWKFIFSVHILFSNVKKITFETSYYAKNLYFLIKASNTENLNPP